MKALWLVKHGTWEIRESPDPHPKAGEVRIQVRATGLNFAELMASQGLYPDAPKLPAIFGYEAAGTIDAVYLDLHGAMVSEHFDDGEGELLARWHVTGAS